MIKRTLLLLILLALSVPAQARACQIAITPDPVVVNAPWHVVVSGLLPNKDGIVLGNGWNDGNFMNNQFFTADASGNIAVDPPLFVFPQSNGLNPTGQHDFQVLKGSATNPGKFKAVCDQFYTVSQ